MFTIPIAAGGRLGAEGSLRLYVFGEESVVERVGEFVSTLYSEPPFPGGVG